MNKNLNFILALIAIDLMCDLLFLNSIVIDDAEDENDEDKHPLIGKRYIVEDNSYAMDKESGVEADGLNGKEYIIVSDPYKDSVKSRWTDESHEHMFVDVFSLRSARKYRVLFQERCVVED